MISFSEQRQSILFVITTLDRGGAETMLVRLLDELDREHYDPAVICLSPRGPLAEDLETLRIPVTSLGLNPAFPNPLKIWTLIKIIYQTKPDLIHTWMYHADLLGGIGGRIAGNAPVLWSLRQSNFDSEKTNSLTLLVVQLCVWLSHWIPERIISCSRTGKEVHVEAGYPADNIEVIPNGFDTGEFHPDPDRRCRMRQELGLEDEDFLIGLVARFHPQKDHETFVRAAASLREQYPNVNYLLCGQGTTSNNDRLYGWIRDEGLEERFYLLGEREDVRSVYCALDLMTSSSAYGEGFANVLGEAMACGVPCVTTDVGDSAYLVGNTGIVVPPETPDELAEGWRMFLEMASSRRKELGERARRRIVEHFTIENIVDRFECLYSELL